MENTSYIATISYEIENLLYQGVPIDTIRKKTKKKQDEGTFPANLELIDTFFDNVTSVSGCAFFDKQTGEAIIGFAGTNLDNGFWESGKDIVGADLRIYLMGIDPQSLYLKKANEFVSNLKKQGYDITQSTGHSLGGALCVLVGIKQNIPTIVSYNGAPLFVLTNSLSGYTYFSIKKMLSTYNGDIYRFVTNDDFLNNAADFANGYYVGEKIVFYNGTGHDLKNFLSPLEQRFIKEVLQSKNMHWTGDGLKVDFNGDGKAEISITPQQLAIKNLLASDNSISVGTTIKINPETLLDLALGFNTMIDNDISWIIKAITVCNEKNAEIKNNKNLRTDNLCERIVEGLNTSGLSELLLSIDESHGKLLKSKNKKTLDYLSTFNTYEVTRKFDWIASSGGRTWYKDGYEFDEYDLINWIKDIQECSQTLLYQITMTGVIEIPNKYGTPNSYLKHVETTRKYMFNTISDIGKSLVAVTNNFLPKTTNVFQGTGIRSGKQDGIVDSLTDVFKVQFDNVKEISNNISSIANMTRDLSTNFSSLDTFLKQFIDNGGGKVQFHAEELPKNYQAYLEVNNIFDDVNVLKAFDKQV